MQLEGWPLGKKKKKEGEEGGGEIFLTPSPKPFPHLQKILKIQHGGYDLMTTGGARSKTPAFEG